MISIRFVNLTMSDLRPERPAGDPSAIYVKYDKPLDFIPKSENSATLNLLEEIIFNKHQL